MPPWWLRSGHLQSIMASLGIRRRHLLRQAQPMLDAARETILVCPDGTRLHGLLSLQPGAGETPMALLIHGWEGSSDSLYMLSAAGHLFAQGYDVFRLHLRDHGPSHHLNEGVFHSCRIDEAVHAVAIVRAKHARGPLNLAGFSLGGNFALRIAVRAPAAALPLVSVVAVCPVLDPAHTLAALESGLPLYSRYFMRKWQRSLHLKAKYFPDRYDPAEFGRIRSLLHLTDYFVREHSDFDDIGTYFRGYAITGNALSDLRVTAHMILAEDDPIIPVQDLEVVARTPALTVTRTRYGGHCGYIDDFSGPSWADREIVRRFGLSAAVGPDSDRADHRDTAASASHP